MRKAYLMLAILALLVGSFTTKVLLWPASIEAQATTVETLNPRALDAAAPAGLPVVMADLS